MHVQQFLALLSALSVLAVSAAPDGNEILAQAGGAKGLSSYAVPVHFAVHMHRPISIRTTVEGMIYYKAPAQSELHLTKLPGPLTGLFKTSYAIDLAAQVWPTKYRVTSTQTTDTNYLLQAVPRGADPPMDHITFTVSRNDFSPLSAAWYYKDGSSVALMIQNGQTSGYALPSTETITVTMPQYALDATANYGAYQINAPIPESSS